MAYFFGQTMTRAAVPPEQIAAMNAPTSQLPGMCSGGNKYACQLAQIKEPTEAEKREMALRREQQAAADREATAKRLENVGQGTVAQAVREQKDVEYTAQGPRIIDSGPSGSGRKPTKQLPAGRVKRMKRVSRPN